MLKPDIKQMLELAKDMGLTTLEDAFIEYMRHYDLFFLMSDYQNQLNNFCTEIANLNWLEAEDNYLRDMTIEECLALLEKAQNDDKA